MLYRHLWPAGLILILALLATFLAVALARRDHAQIGQEQFQAQLAVAHKAISASMKTYGQVLKAGVGLFDANEARVTRGQWAAFVRQLSITREFPGIQGIGYAAVVPNGQEARFMAEQRASGRANFSLAPGGERDLVTAIVFLEPEDARNERALGFDMFSEPVRRRAMEQARDTGTPFLTGAVRLVQEDDVDLQTGTLLYMPVFQSGQDPETVAERRKNLKGFVYGAFRMRDFIEQSLSKQVPEVLENIDLRIVDAAANGDETVLYERGSKAPSDTESSVATGSYKATRDLDVHGVRWRLEGHSTQAFDTGLDQGHIRLLLSGGLLISLLVTGVAASLAVARFQSAEAAKALQAEVAQRKTAQEQEQIANRELIHRVKNTLAVVTAIASQTARHSTTVEEFSTAFRDRLHALARVHDLLKPNPAYAPELGALIRQIIAPYRSSDAASATLTGEHVEVPQNAAVLLSLLFNELATNATKYGAWSRNGGHVDIAWKGGTANGADGIEITWIERGGPPVKEPSKSGFGSNVIQFAIERGLNGKVERTFDPAGIRYVILLPPPRSNGTPAVERPGRDAGAEPRA